MIEIVLVAILFTILIIILQNSSKAPRSYVTQQKKQIPQTPFEGKSLASLESILTQNLGSESLNKRNFNKTRIVIANFESSRLALAKESDCGPMIVLNRDDKRSELIYKVLLSQSPEVAKFLSVLSHKKHFTNKTVDTILSLVYNDFALTKEQI